MKRKVIDCHTHCFPDKVAPNAVGALAGTSFLIPDCDGTKDGYDIELTRQVADNVGIPVISVTDDF